MKAMKAINKQRPTAGPRLGTNPRSDTVPARRPALRFMRSGHLQVSNLNQDQEPLRSAEPPLGAILVPSDAPRRGSAPRFLGNAFAVLAIFCVLTSPAAEKDPIQKPTDLTDLPLEALMNLDVPKVYGASKHEQTTTEAPSSVTVAQADDIRKYGQIGRAHV